MRLPCTDRQVRHGIPLFFLWGTGWVLHEYFGTGPTTFPTLISSLAALSSFSMYSLSNRIAVLGVLSLSAVSAQNNDIPVELGQKEKQIAELLEETVVAKSVEVGV